MLEEKLAAARRSMAASAGLTLAKLAAGLASGSLGVLSEAAHSFLDFGATAITYAAVKAGGKPPDEKHPYGHGKIESVAALAETALLLVTSVWIIYEAVHRLTAGEHAVWPNMWAFIVIIASIAVDYFRARALHRTAEKTGSQALEADALHFWSDMLSSGVVLAGLGLVWLGFPMSDSIAAILVALFVASAGYRMGARAIDALIDAAPDGALERITAMVEPVEGVLGMNRLRARPVGPALFVDMEIAVSRTLPLDRVDRIKRTITDAITSEFRDTEVNVVCIPVALTDETVSERVQLIAARAGLPVHHITVQNLNGGLSVSFDVEVDRRMPLGEAHALASALEAEIQQELGKEMEVESHIEPLHSSSVSGSDAGPELASRMTRDLNELASAGGELDSVRAVRVRRNELGLFVTFHCLANPACTVEAVHDAVDALETAFRSRWPEVRRVVAHAEPRTAEEA
jgi:cation diffusion facilitator family transporter